MTVTSSHRFRPSRAIIVCMALAMTSCSSTPRDQLRREEMEDRLIEDASHKGWIDFTEVESVEDRKGLLDRAIKLSRSTMAHHYERVVEMHREWRQRKQEEPAVAAAEIQDEEADEGTSFEFRDARLDEVVHLVAGELELNVLVPLEMTERVTASFPSVDPRNGLETILARYGYKLTEENGIHTVERVPEVPIYTETFSLKTGIKFDVAKEISKIIGEDGSVSTDPENRGVVVTSTEEGIEQVRKYLSILDKRPRQVLIEALVVEVARTTSHRRGTRLSFQDIDFGSSVATAESNFLPTPASGGANPFTLGFFNAKHMIEAMLAADDGINRLHVLHSPFVSTLSGKKATIKIIQSIPYVRALTSIGAAEGESGGTLTSQEEIEFEEAGVTLDVEANVGDDDIVEVTVKPKVEELVGFLQGVPVIDTREAESTIMIRNEQTLVIGGLLRNSFTEDVSKVPLLGDIPILGELFKRTTREEEKIELMIFVTPHVLGYGFEPYKGFVAQDYFLGPDKPFNNTWKLMNRENRDRMRIDD